MKKNLLVCFFIILLSFPSFNVQRSEGQGTYAGSEACQDCHQDKWESYVRSYHGVKGDPRTPAAKRGCESCHGPAAAHVEAGGGRGVGGIKAMGQTSVLSAEQRSEVCLQCHAKGKVALWSGSSHEARGLSCSSCHSIHAGYPKNLSKPVQQEVCIQCHKTIISQLLRQSHHPIREGKIKCADCHNTHGTIADKLIDAQYVNLKCYECHAEYRGPFLWEHAPVTEDCLTCHTPHGSTHERLLKAKPCYLCQRCHSGSRHPGTLYARSTDQRGESVYRALSNRAFYRACLNCHPQIHGSNHSSGHSLMR